MSNTNLLTLSDVYKPPSIGELVYLNDTILRNRLAFMKAEQDMAYQKGWGDWMGGGGGGNAFGPQAPPPQPTVAGSPNPLAPPPPPASDPTNAPAAYPQTPSGIPGSAAGGWKGAPGTVKGPIGYHSPNPEADAEMVVRAMERVESGGGTDKKAGKNVLQYQPNTWARYSAEYNGVVLGRQGPLPDTPQNQRMVGKFKAKQWLEQGYSPQQIASMWNAGDGKPDWAGHVGINPQGVAYDTPNHVAKFTDAYNELARGNGMEVMGDPISGEVGKQGLPPSQMVAGPGASPPNPTSPASPTPNPAIAGGVGGGGGEMKPGQQGISPNYATAYNQGRIQAAMVPFTKGLDKALSTNNQQTLTKYLDYVDSVAPFLRSVTMFYRGLELNPDGAVKGVLPPGTVTRDLISQWLPRIPNELLPVFQEAEKGKLPVKFELDANKRVKNAEISKDVLKPDKYSIAKQAVEEKKKAKGDTSPATATEIEDHLAMQQLGEVLPGALDRDARYFGQTGKMPSNIGFGTSANRYKMMVRNRWEELAREQGLENVDMALREAKFKATKENLSKAENILTFTDNYERTVRSYMPILREQFAKVKPISQIKKINELEMAVERDVFGDADARTLYTTLYEVLVDYSKVITGNFSIAGLTDTARKEGQRLLDMSDNEQAREKILENMELMMDKRMKSLQETAVGVLERGGLTPARGDRGGKPESSPQPPTTTPHPDVGKKKGTPITEDKVDYYIKRANGDIDLAKKLAREDGYEVE